MKNATTKTDPVYVCDCCGKDSGSFWVRLPWDGSAIDSEGSQKAFRCSGCFRQSHMSVGGKLA